MRRARLLIADDHALVLDGFRKLLAPAYDIVGTVTDGQSLVRAAEEVAADVILIDLSMPQLNGLDAIQRIKARGTRARLIVLTMQEDRDVAAEAIRRGASAFVLKSSAASELFEAIEAVLAGRIYLSPSIADAPPGVFAGAAARNARGGSLTLRQREVLQLVAEGKSMKEAARVLGVTPRTIAFHKYSIMEQLGLKTSAQLVQHAVTLGLVTPARRDR